jgi:hypothetical protein
MAIQPFIQCGSRFNPVGYQKKARSFKKGRQTVIMDAQAVVARANPYMRPMQYAHRNENKTGVAFY